MARRPLKPCAHPGCPELVRSGPRCDSHQRKRATRYAREDARRRGTARERGYDTAWEKVRQTKLAADPLCEKCGERGATTPADMVHHIVPVRRDRTLRLVMSNLQSLCNACHAAEHAVGAS